MYVRKGVEVMRKVLIALLVIIFFGAGYFVYGEVNKSETVANASFVKEKQTTKKEIIKKDDVVDVRTTIPLDRVWEYSFGEALDKETLKDNIQVKDSQNQSVDINVELTDEGKKLLIKPPTDGYVKGEKYDLTISEEMKYASGANVSRSHHMQFVTVRDEVEKAIVNPNAIKIDKDEVSFVGTNEVKINKDGVTDIITIEDIIIIPTEEHPEGQALKITKIVDENSNSYTVSVVEPEFTEVYEKLDIYKSYPITNANFTPEKGLEGVTVTSLSSKPINLVAGEIATKNNEFEYKESSPVSLNKTDNGLQIELTDVKFNKELNIGLNGFVNLFSPEVKLDIDTGFLVVNRFELSTLTKVNSELIFKKEMKKNIKATKPTKLSKKLRLGTILVPTGVPGLFIRGDLVLKVQINLNGEIEVFVTIDKQDKNGFIYENDKVSHLSDVDASLDIGIQGKGKATGKFGPALDVLVTAFGVYGAGIEGFAGARMEGEAMVGSDSKKGSYGCASLAYGGFTQASFVINDPLDTLYEYVFAEIEVGLKYELNNCKTVIGIVPVEQIGINSGESRDVAIEIIEHNMMDLKETKQKADMDLIDVSVSEDDVVTVKKTKNGILVTAAKDPAKENTTIKLVQNVKGETQALEIPVSITDFKKKQEEKANNWNGEWTRTSVSNPGTMRISDFDGKTFNLVVSVLSGGHTSDIKGMATVSGKKAKFVDVEFDFLDCQLDMVLDEDSIKVEETMDCTSIGGIGTFFEGDYKNQEATKNTPKSTLSSLNIIGEEQDVVIQELLGEDYDKLVNNMQMVSPAAEKYGLSDAVIYEGSVRGMNGFFNGIIMINSSGNYYIANIVDGEKVVFYTTDSAYANQPHEVIETWRQEFAGYPVEYVYKPIN